MNVPLADRIVAVTEAIAGERKAMAVLNILPVPDAAEHRRRFERRIAALEAVLADLRRARAPAPPKGAAA